MIDCNVIADLLPLYVDNTCSKESSELVEEHIKNCKECTKLLAAMQSEKIQLAACAPELASRKLFRSVRKSLVIVVICFLVMVMSYCFNWFKAYYGNTWTLVFTMLYVAAWLVLTVHVKEIIPLIGVNLTFGVITLVLDISHFIERFLLLSGILSAEQYVDMFVLGRPNSARDTYFYLISIPFHGLTNLTDFKFVYPVSTIISLIVVIYSIVCLKKWKKYRS